MFQINYNLVLFNFSFSFYKLLKNKHIVADETGRTGCGYGCLMLPLEGSVSGCLTAEYAVGPVFPG